MVDWPMSKMMSIVVALGERAEAPLALLEEGIEALMKLMVAAKVPILVPVLGRIEVLSMMMMTTAVPQGAVNHLKCPRQMNLYSSNSRIYVWYLLLSYFVELILEQVVGNLTFENY